MKRTFVASISACLLIWAASSAAYEPGTHQRLTEDAVRESAINPFVGDIPLFDDWGLDMTTVYHDDHSGKDIDMGFHTDNAIMLDTAGFLDLIKIGAAFEDDEKRGMCHFYDPVNKRHLHLGSVAATFSAPEWATGVLDDGDQDSVGYPPDQRVCELATFGDQTQNYSLKKAEDYFYGAFTAATENDRKNNFGELFLSMGHTLHLLEDMGQPQHVRNDMHCDNYACAAAFLYNPSKYEDYVYGVYNEHEGTKPVNPYGPVSLSSARSYWSDDAGGGLADYTNRNFFSAGTLNYANGTSVGYASPQVDPAFPPVVEDIKVFYPSGLPYEIDYFCRNRPDGACHVTFLPTRLEDRLSGQSAIINSFAVAKSFFNEELTNEGAHQVYTLNRITEGAAWDILYPQIVSYASGLINHVFRGRLDVKWDETQSGDPMNFEVTNLSDGGLGSNGGPGGDLGIYYDGVDGVRHRINPNPNPVSIGAYCASLLPNGQPNATCTWLPSDKMQISVQLSALSSAPVNPNEYIFVYKGPMSGDEDTHIVAKYFKPDAPEFELLVRNYKDQNNNTWDANLRYSTKGNAIFEGKTPVWVSSGCSTSDMHRAYYCSLPADLAFYRRDANGHDREYTVRDAWGITAFESNESYATPMAESTVTVVRQFDFAKYTRDVDAQGHLLPFTHPEYQDCFEGVNRIAVNSTHVFVAVNRYAHTLSPTTDQETSTPCPYDVGGSEAGAGMYIDMFDHDAVDHGILQSITKLPKAEFFGDPHVFTAHASGLRSFAASNRGLCLVGEITDTDGINTTVTGFAQLRALTGSGSQTVIGPAQPIDNASAVGCAATSDRYYIIDTNPSQDQGASNNGIAVLNSYDLNGTPKGSVVLQKILDDGLRPFKIAASSSMIYVMSWQASGVATRVYRYERRVVNGMDTFTLVSDKPTVRNPHPLPNPFVVPSTGQSGSQAMTVDLNTALLNLPEP